MKNKEKQNFCSQSKKTVLVQILPVAIINSINFRQNMHSSYKDKIKQNTIKPINMIFIKNNLTNARFISGLTQLIPELAL